MSNNFGRGDPSLYLPVPPHLAGQPTVNPQEALGPGGVEINEWAPESDVIMPDDFHAREYVPRIERVPPYPFKLPRQPDPAEVGQLAYFDDATKDHSTTELGFQAHTVVVDNFSNQWLFFPAARRWVPPSMWDVVLPIYPATSVAEWHVITPSGYTAGPIGTTGSPVVTIWYAAEFPPSVGLIIPAPLVSPFTTSTTDNVTQWGGSGVGVANGGFLSGQSSNAAILTDQPGQWGITNAPGAGAQATISRAAVGARHVCTGFIIDGAAGLVAPVATVLTWALRDGASGAGAILAQGVLSIPATAGFDMTPIPVTGLNLIGSFNTAMTLEWSAGLANFSETVSLFGYDAA